MENGIAQTQIRYNLQAPSKRENFMQGIHAKQECASFGVLGRLSGVWIAYLRGRMNN